MKAKIFSLMALVLCLVSCQTEPEGLDVIVGGEVDTVVTVSLPETTRANSAEGAFANVDFTKYTIRYILQIYYKGEPSKERLVKYSDGKEVAFPVRLVPDRDYNFVVWADLVEGNNYQENEWDNEDGIHYNTSDLKNITLNNTWVAMDETRDAFTGYFNTATDGNKTPYNGSKAINIPLTRPFAKLRVMTTDMAELAKLDLTPKKVEVNYHTKHYSTFDAFAGAPKGNKTVTKSHTIADVAAYGEAGTLFVDYFFATDAQEAVQFDITVYDQNGDADVNRIKYNNFNTDIPVKSNFLTTIKGNVLTDGNNIKVEVEDGGKFDGEENWPDENAEQLAYVAMFGGEVTLTEDITLTQPLEIAEGANVVINLGDKTITGALAKDSGAIIENNGILTIVGGTLENTAANGDAVINNTGELVLEGVKIKGAPIGTTGYPNYAVYTSGKLIVNDGTQITSDRGVLNMSGSADVTINGGKFVVTDNVGTRTLTAHVIYAYSYSSKLTINDGNFEMNIENGGGTSVICPAGATIKVYGGNFYHVRVTDVQSGCFQNYMGNGAPVDVYGGVFNDDTVTKSGNLAEGYKAIAADGIYYVLPETIANAAEAEGVTAVTESTADVATALATNNGKATLFMWNDVAYIAKYGKVVITSAADEATTVRGVVENSTGLTSATVADGIEVVGNRTFRKCTNLETVVLPNTLTEIGPAVFQSCSKLANITIPESVTTIGEGAFAECTSLKSINIPEGITRLEKDVLRNTGLVSIEIPASVNYIGTYAFRDCEELTEIIINAPVFTVESDTFLNAAGPFPAYVIKVANAEMKAYLESRLSAHQKTFITVVAPEVVTTVDELKAAIEAGAEKIMLVEGSYTIPSSAKGKTLHLVGIGNAKDIDITVSNENGSYEGCNYNLSGSTVTFENISINTPSTSYIGYAGCKGTYKDCIINGFYCLYDNSNFENCTFNVSGDTYNIWTWSAPSATFTDCTFNSDGKSIMLYGGGETKLTVNGCVFNDNGGLVDELKAAIEVGDDYGTSSFELIVNKTDVNGFAINNKGINTGTTLWGNKNSMPQKRLNVVVDGVDVY